MLRKLMAVAALAIGISSTVSLAADRADEYLPLVRLTDNYEVNNRKQNYDQVQFPISINKKLTVEGEKIIIEYGYRNSNVNASRLQFQRHFEKLQAAVGGELIFAGKSDDYRYSYTFRFPKNGKTVWVLASTSDSEDIHYYRLAIVESAELWSGAAVAAKPVDVVPVIKPAPPVIVPPPSPVTPPVPAAAWKGGDWKEVDYGGCDGHDIKISKSGAPDDDYCDAEWSGKVAICYANGCTYKNVTPKQCKDGSKPGRMYVCTPR